MIKLGGVFSVNEGQAISTSFQHTTTKEHFIPITEETWQDFQFHPGTDAIVKLVLEKGTVKYQVNYRASISGSTIIWSSNNRIYSGFNNLLNPEAKKRFRFATQIIEFGFYSKEQIILQDAETKQVLRTINF